MTADRRRSILDLNERQVQNLMCFVGLGILVYWAVTKFNPDAILAGLVSTLLIGQRLIPLVGRRDPPRPENDDVARNTTTRTRTEGRDDRDLDDPGRHVSRQRLGFAAFQRPTIRGPRCVVM